METLETGDIGFVYVPRVEEEDPGGLDDVQDLRIVLRPDGRSHTRVLVVGRKRLPDVDDTERYWGFVETVTDDPRVLRDEFRAEQYDTATRGRRHQPAARAAGEGVYALVRRGGDTFLAYVLDVPQEGGEVQRELRIAPRARYVLAVRDPAADSPPGVGLSPERRADYPAELREVFGERRWVAADPPALLDHEGAELVIIAAAEDVQVEGPGGIPPLDPDDEAELTEELDLLREDRPTEPLLEGGWD